MNNTPTGIYLQIKEIYVCIYDARPDIMPVISRLKLAIM